MRAQSPIEEEMTHERLKLILMNREYLFTANGKVKQGKKIFQRSNIDDIVDFILLENGTFKAPPGANSIVAAMIVDPKLRNYIRNKQISMTIPVYQIKTWLQASKLVRSTSTPKKAGRSVE